MKNKQTQKYFAVKCLILIVATCAVLVASCSTLGGFTRNTAARLIENSNNYKAPATMTIDIGGRLANAGAGAWQTYADEPAEAAIPRAREDFGKRHPQIIVAEQLGFIKLYFERAELRSLLSDN